MEEDKLCTNERRMNIIDYLVKHGHSTRHELAKVFSVSINTVTRDIESISRYAPIYTRSGNNGGVYIMPDYRHTPQVLSNMEVACLYRVLELVKTPDKDIILGIIAKYARKSVS